MDDLSNRRILIIDDSPSIHDDFRKILTTPGSAATARAAFSALDAELFGDAVPRPREAGYELASALQGEEAYRLVEEQAKLGVHYALAFVDMRMPPGWDGVQTIANIWKVDPDVEIVICSAYSSYTWERILEVFGASDRLLVLKKPFDNAEVLQLACALTKKWQLARQARLKMSELESMVEQQTRELKTGNERLRLEIAERSQIEAALRLSESRYALAAAGSQGGLWDWDLKARKIYYSPRWKGLCGYQADEISDSPDEWLRRVHPDDLEYLQLALNRHLEEGEPHFECEYRLHHRDGRYCWMLARGLAERDEHGVAKRIAGSQNDVTARRMAEEQLRHDALHDALTGLPNRSLIIDRLRQALLRAQRNPEDRFAVLFIDVDHFKLANDTLGHLAGDLLLIEIGRRLVSCVRASDSVSHDITAQSPVARFGGDEFVVLLEGLRHDADAIRVAVRLQDALSAALMIDDKQVFVSLSIGIAPGTVGYAQPDDILRDADAALYQAKAKGRGCYTVFDTRMHSSMMSRWWIENELRTAMEHDQLRLVYQPVVSLTSAELVEFEALLRWQHPERGAISPGEFIPIAEETGLIIALGKWVMRAALAQLRAWEPLISQLGAFSLAVNVSGKQLGQPEFINQVSALLHESGVASGRVRLEVTESAVMTKALASDALAQMKELDLRLHLDDFGTGYSSLAYLHRLPVEALKIDRTFIAGLASDPSAGSIVESIILLAHTLGARVIAEGVETEEQAARLRALKCDMAQGYLFSRPLEVAAASAYLESALSAQSTRVRTQSERPSLANPRQ